MCGYIISYGHKLAEQVLWVDTFLAVEAVETAILHVSPRFATVA